MRIVALKQNHCSEMVQYSEPCKCSCQMTYFNGNDRCIRLYFRFRNTRPIVAPMKVLNNHDFKTDICKQLYRPAHSHAFKYINYGFYLNEPSTYLYTASFIHTLTQTIKQMQPATHLFVGTHFSQSRYWHRIIRTHSQTMTAVAPVSMLIKINCTIYLIQYTTHNVHVFAHRNELATVSTAISPTSSRPARLHSRTDRTRYESNYISAIDILFGQTKQCDGDRKGERDGKRGKRGVDGFVETDNCRTWVGVCICVRLCPDRYALCMRLPSVHSKPHHSSRIIIKLLKSEFVEQWGVQ